MSSNCSSAPMGLKELQTEKELLAEADPQHPVEGTFRGMPQSCWKSFVGYDPIALTAQLNLRVLVLQGGSDFQVPPARNFSVWLKTFENSS